MLRCFAANFPEAAAVASREECRRRGGQIAGVSIAMRIPSPAGQGYLPPPDLPHLGGDIRVPRSPRDTFALIRPQAHGAAAALSARALRESAPRPLRESDRVQGSRLLGQRPFRKASALCMRRSQALLLPPRPPPVGPSLPCSPAACATLRTLRHPEAPRPPSSLWLWLRASFFSRILRITGGESGTRWRPARGGPIHCELAQASGTSALRPELARRAGGALANFLLASSTGHPLLTFGEIR